MALLTILKKGDPTLRKIARPVEAINARILTLLDDMAQTMYEAHGAGLAAPQVGVLRRVVTIDTGEGLIELINPEIIEASGEQTEYEACLSVPDLYGVVKRPMKVTVRATDRHGNTFIRTGEGLLAKAFCHEIDHLDGILYTDKALELLTPDEVEAD